jgi:acetylornithine deacetylase/succinyl-diaminopimelate desuccinylase-like protein
VRSHLARSILWPSAYWPERAGGGGTRPGADEPSHAGHAGGGGAVPASALRAQGLSPESHAYATGANVFARLDGTAGSTEHVVLGAHYDTVVRSPGANDNASGVALVLAAGRALAQLGCRSRPVLLVFFDQAHFFLVGWDANDDRLVELERPDPGLRAVYEAAQRALGLTAPLVSTTTAGSDHSAFRPTFPAVGITEGYRRGDTTPHRHRPGDTAETIDVEYLGATTTLVVRAIAELLR